jgi:hypothetical protein
MRVRLKGIHSVKVKLSSGASAITSMHGATVRAWSANRARRNSWRAIPQLTNRVVNRTLPVFIP